MLEHLRVLLNRPDFHRNPFKALWRRAFWRIRWCFSSRPWLLPLPNDIKIAVPHCGTGALIYYQDVSEPITINFVLGLLKEGMVFWDIGAHIGEYTLLAAKAVGDGGQVHSFEPHPEIFDILQRNVQMNMLRNVILNNIAVTDRQGELDFEIFTEPSISRLRATGPTHSEDPKITIKVDAVSLDKYTIGRKKPDLIKIDVEGAEIFVLRGMRKLLERQPDDVPTLIFEFNPANFSRYAYEDSALLGYLKDLGFSVFTIYQDRVVPVKSEGNLKNIIENNLVASKNPSWLNINS